MQEEDVTVPNEGTFEIKAVDDVLVPQVIIDIKPLEPNLLVELKEKRNSNAQSKLDLPKIIQETKGRTFNLLDNKKRKITIHEIHTRGFENKSNEKLAVELIIEEKNGKLNVTYNRKKFDLALPKQFNLTEIIDNILKLFSPKADLKSWRLPQNPSKLKEKELISFYKNFEKNNVSISSLGKFDKVKLINISIFPDSQKSAEKWSKALFIEKKLSKYITAKQLVKEWGQMMKEYQDKFDKFDLPPPKITDLLEEIDYASRKYWFLQAPLDMQIEEMMISD